MSFLREILAYKRQEIACRRAAVPVRDLKLRIRDQSLPRGFRKAIEKPGMVALIAEIKKASPSRGVIREDFDPLKIAETYAEGGADAISVLTDRRFFQGDLEILSAVRERVPLPLLEKDFVVDEYQVYEARVWGADAVLLIAAVLDRWQLEDYGALAGELGMDAVYEIHTERELEQVVDRAEIIGINNRDLDSFKTEIATTFRILREVPDDRIVVSESGIETRDQVLRLHEAGVDAILVGESLMREKDIASKLKALLGGEAGR